MKTLWPKLTASSAKEWFIYATFLTTSPRPSPISLYPPSLLGYNEPTGAGWRSRNKFLCGNIMTADSDAFRSRDLLLSSACSNRAGNLVLASTHLLRYALSSYRSLRASKWSLLDPWHWPKYWPSLPLETLHGSSWRRRCKCLQRLLNDASSTVRRTHSRNQH